MLSKDKIFRRDVLFFIFIFVLSLLAYGIIIFNPGTVSRIDLDTVTPYNFPNWADHWISEGVYTWWEINSGYPFFNLSFLPVIIFAKTASFILNADQFKKLLFVIFTALSGWSSYLMVKNLMFSKVKLLNARHRIASLIAAFGYMFNPWVFDHLLFSIPYIFAYAIAPLAFTYVVKTIDSASKSNKQSVILAALTVSLVAILSLPVGYMLFFATILYFIFKLTFSFQKFKTRILRTIFIGAIFLILMLALNAYWLPQFFSNEMAPLAGISVSDVRTNAIDCYVYNVFRLRGSPYGFFTEAEKSLANPVTLLLSFIIPLLSFLSLIIKPKDEKVIFFSILAATSIVLGAGILGPLGDGYIWLFLNIPYFNAFRVSYKFVFLTSLAYTCMLGVVAEYLLEVTRSSRIFNRSNQATKCITLLMLLFALSLNAAPMLTGNMAGYLPNFQLPNEYNKVYDLLATQPGDFRILLLPMNTPIKSNWLPAKIPSIHNPLDVNPPNHPVICQDYATATTTTLIKFFNNAILDNETNDFNSLLAMLSIRYIVVNKDNLIGEQLPPPDSAAWKLIAYGWQGFYIPPEKIMNFLTSDKELTITYNGVYLSVFEYNNKLLPHISASIASSLIVGDGYDALTEMPPSTTALYAIQYDEDSLLNDVNIFNNVLFYNANITDLALSTLDQGYVFAAYDYAYQCYSFSKYWIKSDYFPVTYAPFKQGAPIDGKFAFAEANDVNMSIHFSIKNDRSYEVWASVWFGSNGGTLGFTLGDKNVTADTFSLIPGFKWIRIFGFTDLPSGEYSLEITNIEGENVINRIAIVPSSILNELQNRYTEILQGKDVVSIHTGVETTLKVYDGHTNSFNWTTLEPAKKDSVALYYSGWKAVIRTDGSELWDGLSFSSRDECPYEFPSTFQGLWDAYNSTLVYMITGQEPVKIEAIYADKKPAEIYGAWWNSDWVGMSTKPITFPITIPSNQRIIIQIVGKADRVTILFGNATEPLLNVSNSFENYSTEDAELTYEKINPTKYIVQVNASKPFFLAFSESYHKDWIAYVDGQQVPDRYHLMANGYANAWYIDKTGTYTVTLEFWPQKLFYIGSAISIITLILCMLYVSKNKIKPLYYYLEKTKRSQTSKITLQRAEPNNINLREKHP